MYTKNLLLFFTIASINASLATQPDIKNNDKETILLSKQEIAQKQLNHLTIDAPFWTSPTKGLTYALIGATVVISSAMLNEDASKVAAVITGGILMAAGFTFAGLSAVDNDTQRTKYQKELIFIQKK